MRRKDRQIEERETLQAIMKTCRMCSLAFQGAEYPYVIPMTVGAVWEGDSVRLYFHGAGDGTKIRRMDADSRVAFSMAVEREVLLKEPACKSTMRYASICGRGHLGRVTEPEEIKRGLTSIMHQYDPEHESFHFEEAMVASTQLLCLTVEAMTGKSNDPEVLK